MIQLTDINGRTHAIHLTPSLGLLSRALAESGTGLTVT